jgi:GT2 family glycosyltransferase
MKIGVIIPFYGGSAYIDKLLNSVLEDKGALDIHVYIVDNSKQEEKLDKSSVNYEDVFILDCPAGLGYGKACNIGYRKCCDEKCDIAIIVNQDGYFSSESLKKLVETLLTADEYAAAVPLLTEYTSNQVESFFTHVYLTPMTELVSDLFAKDIKPFYPILDLCGACFAIKIKDYPVPFLFDDIYHMYSEDDDLYFRISRLRKKVMFVPSARFHHFHTNTKEELQSITSLTVKRTSKHIYNLKNSRHSLGRALGGWAVLEFRNLVQAVFQFQFRYFVVELFSCIRLAAKIPAIQKRRNQELVLSRLNDCNLF